MTIRLKNTTTGKTYSFVRKGVGPKASIKKLAKNKSRKA